MPTYPSSGLAAAQQTSATSSPAAGKGRGGWWRWAALAALCASQLMVILDGSVVAVALPLIGKDLAVSGASLSWVVNAYLVPFGGLLLLAGRFGDVLGSRRMLLLGLANNPGVAVSIADPDSLIATSKSAGPSNGSTPTPPQSSTAQCNSATTTSTRSPTPTSAR